MPSQSILALALAVSTAVAAPSFRGQMIKSREPNGCGPFSGDQPFIADIGFYSDKDCNDKIDYTCVYTYQSVADDDAGAYGCNPGLLPDTTPFWAKVEESPFDEMQIIFTRDQTCPPNGPGAVFATLIDNSNCVEMNLGGEAPGISVYPKGGSGLSRKNGLAKRADPKCDGFEVESSTPSSSESVQVSVIVDCVNGSEQGCEISVEKQHSESVTTSYSLSAGGGIEGIFSVEATFGQEFTSESSTSVTTGFSVQQGQKGYLSAYSAATLFKGKFTGCDSGDSEQAGEVLAIKKEGFTYAVVNTGARQLVSA